MDITYKFVLDKRRLQSDRIYTLKLRIFQNRRFKEQATGIKLHETAWDDKLQIILQSDFDYKKNCMLLSNLKTRIERVILIADTDSEYLTPDILLERLEKQGTPKASSKLADYGQALINSF